MVSKVFPSNALNDKMYIDTSGILVVKTDYASAAYLGLRHAVIHQFQVQSRLNTQQEREGAHDQILGVLKDWMQGNKLKDVFAKIDEARKATIETEDLLQKLQTYNERTVKSSREFQIKIRGWLQESTQILGELQEKLPLDS
ncbi:hypothetical protein [Candidatus Nitrososphaera gargensis]|uniref:hypothetical protein n=1 Tax=Candidatus Nitrososphaera gargensis TaxID=497727 RepID=UPI0022513C25|nr:hypothetical protein [Candidatus Nitrososphaera gargensis]